MARIDVLLECGHYITLTHTSPVFRYGEQALCRFDGWQHTKATYGQAWRALCMQCRAVYWTRDDMALAHRLANKHRRQRGHDDIEVSFEDKVKPRSKATILIDRLNDSPPDDMLYQEPLPPPF